MKVGIVNIYIDYFFAYCKTQIRILPSNAPPFITSYSDLCPSNALSPHICVLCYVTPRYMSFLKHISSDLCPLASYSDLCSPKHMFPHICVLWHTQIKVICQKQYPDRSVSSTLGTESKNIYCNLQPDSYLGYPLVSSSLISTVGCFIVIS